jgi:2'-5' RNA ligase
MSKRCFIALNLPQEARWQIEGLIADLEKINRDKNIKFIDPRQAHITLHFLGELKDEQIEQVKKILGSVCAKFMAAEIITGQINGFPDPKQPHTIYLDCREIGGRPLAKLQTVIGRELKNAGIMVENRKWQPHLTLARIKGPGRFHHEGIELSELTIPIASLGLMSSELSAAGPEYSILGAYNLNI